MHGVERRFDALHKIEGAGRNAVEGQQRADEEEDRCAGGDGEPITMRSHQIGASSALAALAASRARRDQFRRHLAQARFGKALGHPLPQQFGGLEDQRGVQRPIMDHSVVGFRVHRLTRCRSVGSGAVSVGACVTRKQAQDQECDNRDDRDEQQDGQDAGFAEIVQPLHRQRHVAPQRGEEDNTEHHRPHLSFRTVFRYQHETIERQRLRDRQKQPGKKIGRAADAAGKTEEKPC